MCMKFGTPVRDHMLALIVQFNVAEVLGADIKSETQVNMALETLRMMFSQFKVSYNMNKLNMSLTELMKELQNAANILKTKSGDAFVVPSVGSSSSKPNGNGGNKRKKSKFTSFFSSITSSFSRTNLITSSRNMVATTLLLA
ncbi:hypothetical protein DH2020_014556 [Rehmannia glutinosa]|uniref:Uncharacterized protein n=1 Tax=Rehmannia glutinosa TaxID=99300 RepID=A0ABR0WZA5_REHGL